MLNAEAIVGAAPQYTMIKARSEIPRGIVDNEILPGDLMDFRLNIASDSDITAILINDAAFFYPTTHIGDELDYL